MTSAIQPVATTSKVVAKRTSSEKCRTRVELRRPQQKRTCGSRATSPCYKRRCESRDSNPDGGCPLDPKSSASANSATLAICDVPTGWDNRRTGIAAAVATCRPIGCLADYSTIGSLLQKEGWVNLFDGKTLDGWIPTGAKGAWTVKDGMLVGRGNTAHLFAKTRYTARPTTATKTLVDGYFKRRTRWRLGV